MTRSNILWIAAIIITIASVIYQRATGPTRPVDEEVIYNGTSIKGEFKRTHGGENDHQVIIELGTNEFEGELHWKRYKTNDEWNIVPMEKQDLMLTGYLPHQPPAGKLAYKVIVTSNFTSFVIPREPVVIRFKGDVPTLVLIPHIIFMFLAMILSMRAGLEIFNTKPEFRLYTSLTILALFIGGLIFGPIVQKYAFGEFWTGFPFGTDLTDNKTLIAFIGWAAALIAVFRIKKPTGWVIAASLIMIITYLIPHSALGSELDYNKLDRQKGLEEMKDTLN